MRALNGPASDRQASDRQASDRTSQTRGAIIDRVCLQCHAPADPTNRFCGRCGTPLHTRCGSCLAIVAPGLDFCTNCGSALFPPLREPDAVREERRTVSVLFIDLAGFTGFAERLDPEDLRQLQVAYFSTASGVIRRYGGIVEKYIGDAVMAVFGVPVETEHDAYRAVRAALELQRELDNRPLAGRYRLRARVGVATGEALVDLAAARHAGEALVSGDVVATAARLQAHAPHGGVLVSASTRRATYASIRYGDQPQQVQLAGRSGLVEVWLAEGQVGRELTIDDEVTPLVGRDHELDLLTTALMRCVREREAGLVCVVGAHGLGKSRLVRELGRRIDAVPELVVRWRVGRCLPYGEGATYAALAEIVKTQSDVQDNDDPATTRQRLATVLAEVLPPSDVDRLAQLIGPLAGLPGRAVSPGEIEAAWQEALLALARHTPTVLVVEDLHFADPAMRKFLAGLVEAASDVPLFVLCTHRPELLDEQPTWAATLPGTLTASLGPLRGARLRELIATLLHSQDMPEELTDRLATITGGNPMYAVEYTRMLAERAAGAGLDLDAELEIPETVHGVVANRIDLLGPAERTVLHAAAVLGERVWPGAIAAMLSVGPAEVAQPLQGLQRRDMLVMANASAVAGESELAFRHLLLRDVAYRRLPRATRAALHRRAAQWFDQVSAEGRDDLAAAVAHHRVAVLTLTGGLGEDTTNDAEAARRALTAAADAAFAVYAVGPALSDVKQALNLWPTDQDPQRRNTTELLRWRLEFLHDDQRFYRESGAKKVARVADRMREDGDRHGEARAETLLGQVELVRAEREKAAEHLHRAIALFSELPDDAAKAEAYNELARLYMVEFAPAHALTAAQKTRELAQRLGLVDAAADALVTEASARYLTAEPDALAELERAVQLCRAQRLPSLRRATHNLATLLQEEGNLTRAAELWAENRQAQGAHDSLVFHHSEEAEWAYFTGDWVTLLRAAEEYLQRDTETTEWDLQLRCRRAWIQTLCDESAGEDLARCLDTARRSGFTRLAFCAYAHAAFASALAGAHGPAADLLGELTSTWRTAPTAMTVEWLSAAAHASALITSGRSTTQGAGAADVARNVAAVVDTAVRPTRWVAAAEKLVAGASAAAAGRLAEASQQWAAAVEGYDDIGASSDAVLAATWTARASRAAGDEAGAEPYEARVRTFAERNRAPGLLALLD